MVPFATVPPAPISIACNCAESHLLDTSLSHPATSHLPAARVHTSQPNTVTFWEPHKGSHKHTSFLTMCSKCVLPKRYCLGTLLKCLNVTLLEMELSQNEVTG